jgi:hypothetical protein
MDTSIFYGDTFLEMKIPDELIDAVVSFLVKSPVALPTIILAWVSGHTWSYVVFTYFRNKDKSTGFFDGWIGKVALGLLWFALVLIPINIIVNGSMQVDYESILKIVYTTIFYAMALQAVIFILITVFKRG